MGCESLAMPAFANLGFSLAFGSSEKLQPEMARANAVVRRWRPVTNRNQTRDVAKAGSRSSAGPGPGAWLVVAVDGTATAGWVG